MRVLWLLTDTEFENIILLAPFPLDMSSVLMSSNVFKVIQFDLRL